MKKFKKIYLTILFSILTAFGGALLCFQAPQQNIALAQNTLLPTNATFQKYTKQGEDFEKQNNTEIFYNNATFLKSDEVAIFEIGNPEYRPNDLISDIVIDVYLNYEAITNVAEIELVGIDSLNEQAKIVFDLFKEGTPFGEGKYEINLEYFDKNVEKQILNFTFYLYKQSTYFLSGLPAVDVQNVNFSTPAMGSAPYARTHEFFYTNDYTSAQNLFLPTISFDSTKFELSVSKNHSGLTQTTYISLNENGDVTQTLPIVLIKKNGNNVTVTFNDLGAYTINYFMMYSTSTEKFLFSNINSELKPDRMQVYGFQMFHSNINATSSANQQQEFKVIKEDNTIDPNFQTDITFTKIQEKYEDESLMTLDSINNGISSYAFQNIDSRVIFNGNNLSAKSTNQAPVSFKYNATLVPGKSFYYKLNGKNGNGDNLWEERNYTQTSFTDEGTYLVKLTYISDLSTTPSTQRTQWFYFTITTQIPNYSITADGETLSTAAFTKEVVSVSFLQAYNPFDSASKLAVYRKDTISGTSVLVKEVNYNMIETFSQNGIYTVELSRGKNFQTKSISEFIIDTSPITGLVARDVKTLNGSLVKGSASGFFTNQSVAVEWNNKTTNNNTVSGFYKYIPLTQISSFSQTDYSNYYTQKQLIPVPFKLNYKESDNLSTISYTNTININNLAFSNVFTQEGLYMIRAVDKAGNEAFTYFFIDKTTPTILQKDALNNYLSDYSKINVVSETVTIQWGSHKVIQTDLNLENMNFDTWLKQGQSSTALDPWLFKMLKEKANNALLEDENGDFKLANFGGRTILHFAPKIDTDNIMVAVGGNNFVTLTSQLNYEGLEKQDDFSVRVSATKLVDGVLVGIENSYIFRVNDESNKNETSSVIYQIKTSTDVSETEIRFEPENSVFEKDTLAFHNFKVIDNDNSVLKSYFMPINTQLLQLQFLTTTDESSIEIETVTVYYYPYISDYLIYNGSNSSMLQKGTFYTLNEEIVYTGETTPNLIKNTAYRLEVLIDNEIFSRSEFKTGKSLVLAKTPQEIEIYNYNTGINIAQSEGPGAWVWDVHPETVYIANISTPQTMAGKYEVVRTYKQSSEISNTLAERADYITRHLTFIVEREDVISKGLDIENLTYSLVGGSAYIEILAGDANSEKFTSLYLARPYTAQQQNILIETNKLPVKLGFPVAKFGQVINDEFKLLANNYFYTSNPQSYINSFEMGVRVTNLQNETKVSSNLTVTVSSTKPPINTTYVQLDNNLYLIFENVENGYLMLPAFTQEGKYQVDFFQKNTALKGKTSSITLFFQITNIPPDFDIIDSYGDRLPKHDTQDIFYANQNEVIVTWTDSTNPYYAKINKNAITYTINGGSAIYVSNINTNNDGITHWFALPTNVDAQQIVVKMQYEGKQSDYASGAFSKTKTVQVDKTAPTASIENLIAKMDDVSLFTTQTLRNGHNQSVRYNRTITTTPLANFAFAVDASNIQTLILSNHYNDFARLYYRNVTNEYNDPSHTEFDPSQNDALLKIQDSSIFTPYSVGSFNIENLAFNQYYEFVELDKANNITVYTIYLTNVAKSILFEQNEKDDDVYYKDLLSDNFKIIKYTSYQEKEDNNILNRFETVLTAFETNYNLKIYAKQFFNLKDINPYGYKWYLLTFGTTKYLASPKLENGQVYKIQGGTWTAVNFENEINLTLSRSNYVFQIKNISINNINFNVVVSNEKLNLQAPQTNNSTLTITNIRANDTEYVKWETMSIWEYQGGEPSAFAMFDISQPEPLEGFYPAIEGYNLANYVVNGNLTTFNITTKNQAYYRFKIVDNFGHEYVLYYLAGTQFMEKIEELENRELVIDHIVEDDNTPYYISNAGFKFTYYPALTQSVKVQIRVLNKSTLNYEWLPDYILTENLLNIDERYATVAKFANYRTVTLKVFESVDSLKYFGDSVIYKITSTTFAPTAEDENAFDTEVLNFKVNSILPKIVLTGKNKQDLSEILLSNKGIISEPITISFASTESLHYPVNVFLSYNNQTPILLESGQVFSLPGIYEITKVFSGAMGIYSVQSESFSISDQAHTFFSVVQYDEILGKYVDVEIASVPYRYETAIGFEQTEIMQHYIVNTTDWKINLSASQFMKEVDNDGAVFADVDEIKKNGVSTFIRTVSNRASLEAQHQYWARIAITYIPKQNKIVRDFYYLDNQANQIFLTNSEKTYALIKDQDTSNQVEIYWSNYHLIPENKIKATIYYGQDKQQLSSSGIKTRANTNFITLSRSGNYSFVFEDMAGNVHKFDYNSQITNSSSSYEFVFLNSVIFTVNNQAPIQYAIYNNDVELTLPSYTLGYYDTNARPQIIVVRDLETVTDYLYNQSTRTYTFKTPGLYKILFNAKVSGKEIKQEAFYFEIIKEKEIAWVFNIEKYGDYYIERIEKNGIDVTNNLSNSSLGEIVKIQQGTQTLNRLKNLIVSLFDEQTGSGIWTITINTNNDLNQTFTFTFTISDTNPPIVVSHKEGSKTTDVITVSFNARNLYENVGEAVVKIGSLEIYLSDEYFENNNPETQNIDISTIGDTYIQVFTPSGRLVYSYRVTREVPLNTVAIIVIVVSSLAAAGLTVMFVLLRKRMKIR